MVDISLIGDPPREEAFHGYVTPPAPPTAKTAEMLGAAHEANVAAEQRAATEKVATVGGFVAITGAGGHIQ